ncbi:MAG: immunoglobulin-like domain-containing protein, partial [Bacteroidia bacterium]
MLFCCFLLLFTLNARAGNAPYLVLNGADTVISEQGRAFTDPGAVAYDSANNIISNPNIIVSGPPSGYIYIPGTYTLKYNFQHNGVAATEIYRTVIVITDTTAPVLTVLGVPKDSLGYFTDTVAVFETYTAPQATAQDLTDGNLSASIMINSNVNTSVVGTY